MSWQLSNNWEWWVTKKLTVEVCGDDLPKIFRDSVTVESDKIVESV